MTVKYHAQQVSTTWIVVADRARARVFAQDGDQAQLFEVATLIHPESSMKQSDCVSDRQGRMAGQGGASLAPDPRTDWDHKNAIVFARQVADQLEAGRNSHRFGRVVLIAAPAFLGALRSALSAPLAAMVDLEVNKDYTNCSPDEIVTHLAKFRVPRDS